MPVTKEEEDRSKNPLYNRELLKQIMTGAPSLTGGVGAEMPAAAEPAPLMQPAPATPKPAEPAISWSEVPAEAMKNLPSSAIGVAESMVAPIMHPLDTAASIGALGKGAYSKAAGALGAEQKPEEKAKEEAPLNAVIDFYKQRYGTEEGFKQALAKDPAGVAADLSSFLTGGGSMAARAPGMLGKAGAAAAKLGKMEPVTAGMGKLAEGVGALGATAVAAPASVLFSFTTGKPSGMKSFIDAAKAGYTQNPEFIRHFAGSAHPEEIVNRVESAIDAIAKKRSSEYISGMGPIKSNKSLDFGIVDKSLEDALKTFRSPGGIDVLKKSKAKFDEVKNLIDQFRSQESRVGVNNIEDFDLLKRGIDEIHGDYKREYGQGDPTAKMIGSIRNAVFETIKKEDPRYAQVMENYAKTSDQIKELRKEIAGSGTATTASKVRKVLKAQKDESKKRLIAELEEIDPDIGYALSGQELGAILPQGLVGKIMAAGMAAPTAAAALYDPTGISLARIAAASPAVTGAFQYGIGAAGGLPRRMPQQLPYAAGEALEREKERPQRAAGGKVARGMTADMIIAAVKRAHNHGKNETEDMLNLPDESVAKALEVAKRGI